ncbi:hypothetical protein XENORESO_020135 [Xenotaenia resolanae]|uniref:Uncharacterized protein n=1 Tax=Xenotaenia resolanae TaxID=208358 RepID=A0ABV0WL75_9TELE
MTITDLKIFPGSMSLGFSCNIQMVGSEFSVNNMKDLVHSALQHQLRQVVVVYWCGEYFLGTLWAPHFQLIIISFPQLTCVLLLTTVYPSSQGYYQGQNPSNLYYICKKTDS